MDLALRRVLELHEVLSLRRDRLCRTPLCLDHLGGLELLGHLYLLWLLVLSLLCRPGRL